MAKSVYDDDEPVGYQPPKKADIILKTEREISAKQTQIYNEVKNSNKQAETVLTELQNMKKENEETARLNGELYAAVQNDCASLKQEFKYLAVQNESIFSTLTDKLIKLEDELAKLKGEPVYEAAPVAEAPVRQNIDYDVLADKVASRIPAPAAQQVIREAAPVAAVPVQQDIDYDLLVDKLIARLPVPEEAPLAAPAVVNAEIDYNAIAQKVAEKIEIPAPVAQVYEAAPAQVYEAAPATPVTVCAEIDYDVLADKVASRIPAPVAQVYEPAPAQVYEAAPAVVNAEIDYEALAQMVAEKIEIPAPVVQPAAQPVYEAAPVVAPVAVTPEIDYEELADKVVSRIPLQEAVSPDYVAAKIAEQIIIPEAKTAEIDYEELASKIAEKVELPAPVVQPAAQPVVYEGAPAVVNAEIDYEELAQKVAEKIVIPENVLDYELLADNVVARIPVQESVSPEYVASLVAESIPEQQVVTTDGQIDYDALADKIAERIPAPAEQAVYEVAPSDVGSELDYDELAERIAEFMPMQETIVEQGVVPEIDYDALAQKVAELLPATNAGQTVDEEELADRIALKVGAIKAEDFDVLVDDEGCESISKVIADKLDYELIAATVAEKLRADFAEASAEETDYEEMATRISEKITVAGINEDAIADKAAAALSNYLPEIDVDDIADKVASQVISALPSVDNEYITSTIAEKIMDAQAEKDFDIVIDEEGISEISEKVAFVTGERFTSVENEIAELKSAIENGVTVNAEQAYAEPAPAPDYREMATLISENITVAGVDEDAIAQKAAAVLSEYVFNADEIAEKVAGRVLEALPENEQVEEDYNIVIDEEGVNAVSEKVVSGTEERFNAIDGEIAEIKAMLENGVVAVREPAPAETYQAYDEQYVTEESLVTVSDIVDEVEAEQEVVEEEPEQAEETVEPEEEVTDKQPEDEVSEDPTEAVEEPVSETVEETEEEVTEEQPEEEVVEEEPEEVEEQVEETYEEAVEEQPVEEPAEELEESDEEEEGDEDEGDVEEFTLDELTGEGAEGGVDFANMMRYNRSFIARIIQSTDDQKAYYGEVRNALLSYKKVNSNIAWGAERFHKGRETIARFKIRGKTLCLYLALNPEEHEVSVYHHKDVSGVRMFDGTPMMIKVKSPLGVKKAIRLIDEMLEARGGVKRNVPQRDYAAMYPYETMEELIEDGLVKDVRKK